MPDYNRCLPSHPVLLITYSRDAVIDVTPHDRASHVTSILLCPHGLPHTPPRFNYAPVTLGKCIANIPSLEFVLNTLERNSTLMHVPQELDMYIR